MDAGHFTHTDDTGSAARATRAFGRIGPLRTLVERLTAGEHWQPILNEAKALPLAWQTAEWTRTKKQRLGCECGKCGITKMQAAERRLDLVLQHTWHPAKFYDALHSVADELEGEYQAQQQRSPVRAIQFARLDAFQRRRQMLDEWRDRIYREVTLRGLLESIRYMEMRPGDVTTRCKRCAFLEDRRAGQTHAH